MYFRFTIIDTASKWQPSESFLGVDPISFIHDFLYAGVYILIDIMLFHQSMDRLVSVSFAVIETLLMAIVVFFIFFILYHFKGNFVVIHLYDMFIQPIEIPIGLTNCLSK